MGVRDDGCFVPGELGMGLVDGELPTATWSCVPRLNFCVADKACSEHVLTSC